MAEKKMERGLGRGLGRGLDALISRREPNQDTSNQLPTTEEPKSNQMIDIEKIEPNRAQPRKSFNEDSMVELSENIKQYGIISPLLVKKREDYYEIIAGERRWRAAKRAGLKEVPVIIKDVSEKEIVELSLVENIQREDLNPIEEAQAFKRLLDEFGLKQDEVAERVNKSRTAVTNSMRLLKLDERVQQMLIEDLISAGHARSLLGIPDQEKQYEFAQKIFDKKLSVRDVEKEVKKMQQENEKAQTIKENNPINTQLSIILKEQEEKLKTIFGTKVNIIAKDNQKGKIEIEYYTADDLDILIGKFESLA